MTLYTNNKELLEKYPGFYKPIEKIGNVDKKKAEKKPKTIENKFPNWLIQY